MPRQQSSRIRQREHLRANAVDELARGSRTQLLRIYGPEETQRLSAAVNFLVTRLRELEQSRRQLLANLVHELGRPLGALRSAIHAFRRASALRTSAWSFHHRLGLMAMVAEKRSGFCTSE